MADQSTEEILVLYGSQTGNSEGAAQEIASLIPTKLLSKSKSSNNCKLFTSRCIHLDDFLEVEQAKWTRLVIIVCSSYGVGQAPIGARKFRELCDEILEHQQPDDDDDDDLYSATTTNNNNMKSMLNGIHFALLGLGDSHYTTYFQNPTTIHKALTYAGAAHVGSLGQADASGTGHNEQSKVIDRWIDTIWDDLDKVVNSSNISASSSSSPSVDGCLDKAREETWNVCLRIFPEWKPKKTNYNMSLVVSMLPLVAILLAILAQQWYMGIII